MSSLNYYGHGKLLLTGEYFVVDGARGLAVPTKKGQNLDITFRPSRRPKLYWKSVDADGKAWFEGEFDLWHFDVLKTSNLEKAEYLKSVLRTAREFNIHFLRDDMDIHAQTSLEFPHLWGLGSSSTLIYLVSQWAYVSPFEMAKKIQRGSGYDLACAQSQGPIVYQLKTEGGGTPSWTAVDFANYFKNQLYFVYLEKKQLSSQALSYYNSLIFKSKGELVSKISSLTDEAVMALDLKTFEEILFEHECVLSDALKLQRVKVTHFPDYWGEVKSLGAWGGDFALITSSRSAEETKAYFARRGFSQFYSYNQMVYNDRVNTPEMLSIQKKILTNENYAGTWF